MPPFELAIQVTRLCNIFFPFLLFFFSLFYFFRIIINLSCALLWAILTTEQRWTHFALVKKDEDKRPWMELNNMQKR